MSKEWNNIVNSDAHWKKRSKRDLTHISDIEKEHDKQSKKDEHMAWKEFYKRNNLWKITVHILQSHWGTFIDSTFSVKVPPNCSVHEFVEICKKCPQNREPNTLHHSELAPFKKDMLVRPSYNRRGEELPPQVFSEEDHVANCSWNFKNPEMSISEAGLCNGAILCFHSAEMWIG